MGAGVSGRDGGGAKAGAKPGARLGAFGTVGSEGNPENVGEGLGAGALKALKLSRTGDGVEKADGSDGLAAGEGAVTGLNPANGADGTVEWDSNNCLKSFMRASRADTRSPTSSRKPIGTFENA